MNKNKRMKLHIKYLERKVEELRKSNFEYTSIAYQNQQRCKELEKEIERLKTINKPVETFTTMIMKSSPYLCNPFGTEKQINEHLFMSGKKRLLEYIANKKEFFKVTENDESIIIEIKVVRD